jgi:hypothetical protein
MRYASGYLPLCKFVPEVPRKALWPVSVIGLGAPGVHLPHPYTWLWHWALGHRITWCRFTSCTLGICSEKGHMVCGFCIHASAVLQTVIQQFSCSLPHHIGISSWMSHSLWCLHALRVLYKLLVTCCQVCSSFLQFSIISVVTVCIHKPDVSSSVAQNYSLYPACHLTTDIVWIFNCW